MKIIVAPNTFKGSLSAVDAAAVIREGILAVLSDANVIQMPVADGGDGTAEVLLHGLGGHFVEQTDVCDPLGVPRPATFGLLDDGSTAVIEMASASGLWLVPPNRLDPLITTSYGTGQLIKASLNRGCKRIIVGVGGSATVDGGAGLMQALGVKLLDTHGMDIPPGGAGLRFLSTIDTSSIDPRLRSVEIVVACDVDNPLIGVSGAARVFGPQKGTTPDRVEQLEANLIQYAAIVERDLRIPISAVPRGGAAGGVAAGLLAFLNGRLVSGIDLVLDLLAFDAQVKDADLVITSEGKIDAQTAAGKAPIGVARAAKKYGVPVIALAGHVADDLALVYEQGIDAVMSILPRPMPLEQAVDESRALLRSGTERALRLILVGQRLKG